MKNTRLLISVLAFFVACVAPLQSAAQKFDASPSVGFTDGIDRTAPNFVTASLLVMSPGNELYSCVGHSVLRLECPKFGLDYCFTYESESAKNRVLSFLAGNLKMGMFAIPASKHLKMCSEEGRGVMQYTLNLPPDAKQRLWKILDEKVAEGPCLEYDYMERGCAQAAMRVLREALLPYTMEVNPWPEKYGAHSRHELLEMEPRGRTRNGRAALGPLRPFGFASLRQPDAYGAGESRRGHNGKAARRVTA